VAETGSLVEFTTSDPLRLVSALPRIHVGIFCARDLLATHKEAAAPIRKFFLDQPQNTTAAFEMDEILYELKDHMAGLNCGRWDYIFCFIKRFKNIPAYIFTDRAQITMTRHCMRSNSLLAIRTCHRRDAQAFGGMAAQIPIKDDPQANEAALQRVGDDKSGEPPTGMTAPGLPIRDW
jgi:hypothetical protein